MSKIKENANENEIYGIRNVIENVNTLMAELESLKTELLDALITGKIKEIISEPDTGNLVNQAIEDFICGWEVMMDIENEETEEDLGLDEL